jgi:hypothetical protein
MRSVFRPASCGLRVRHLAVLAAPLALALAPLPASGLAAAPGTIQRSSAIDTPSPLSSNAAETSQSPRIELAGRKSGDESFDPYGKDDPNSKKWGAAAGLLGNRYGGLRTGGDSKNTEGKEARNADRDRELRPQRGEEGGKN